MQLQQELAAATQGLEQAMALLTMQSQQLASLETENESLRTTAVTGMQVLPPLLLIRVG